MDPTAVGSAVAALIASQAVGGFAPEAGPIGCRTTASIWPRGITVPTSVAQTGARLLTGSWQLTTASRICPAAAMPSCPVAASTIT